LAISFSTGAIDRLLAPGLSKFTACNAPDLTTLHDQATHWLANHFLNILFGHSFKGRFQQYALNQLFRAEVAFRDYHEARELCLTFFEAGRPDYPAIRTYFKAVSRWESCLLNIQIFIDFMNKMRLEVGDEPVFIPGDGSREQRAYDLANEIKHWGGHIKSQLIEESLTIPVWLTNEGLQSKSYQISYEELATLVGEIAAVADELQEPKSFLVKP
jgi:hypothetical protein